MSAITIAAILFLLGAGPTLALGDEVTTLDAGEYQTCARTSGGTVWCWGYGADGQLGDGDTDNHATPVHVVVGDHLLNGIASTASGTGHTCGLKADRTVRCWGDGARGQLGDGTTGDPTTHQRLSPVKVRKGSGDLTDIVAITAGAFHTCGLKDDGTVWCWGEDGHGQLGDGTTGDASHIRTKAVKVRQGGAALTGITAISAGAGQHTCALRGDGTMWCWGVDAHGQLGDGTTGVPVDHHRLKAVNVRRGGRALSRITGIAAGSEHTCARRADGTAWCWGSDFYGQLGDGTTGDPVDHHRLTPVKVRRGSGALTGVTRIAGGYNHACARTEDAKAWCWGNDDYGQLGDGSTGDPVSHVRLTAVQVMGPAGPLAKIRLLDGGVEHTCAIRTDRTVRCWGWNRNGELGRGTADDDPHPFAGPVAFP